MHVFKFGGASVKNAKAVENVGKILKTRAPGPIVVVFSAMGKTTNALEAVLAKYLNQEDWQQALQKVAAYHDEIITQLFANSHPQLNQEVSELVQATQQFLAQNSPETAYGILYSEVVALGELVSSRIVSQYFTELGLVNQWADARNVIKTDHVFPEALVQWDATRALVNQKLTPWLKSHMVVTQGFIASNVSGQTTTLGREGSDFTGAVLANCLNAQSLTIWKDVPGVLNADPKLRSNTTLYEALSYQEAAEMTYYGAKVIHPKTIKPLAIKSIPLKVKCFDHPSQPGTVIHEEKPEKLVPAYIYKPMQCLISFKTVDFSFIDEEQLGTIFMALAEVGLKINLTQNSAISFSVCVDYEQLKIEQLIHLQKDKFHILYNTGLLLVTIKNYNQEAIEEYQRKSNKLLEQVSRSNYRVLLSGE